MASASSSASRANTVESLPAASNRNDEELPTRSEEYMASTMRWRWSPLVSDLGRGTSNRRTTNAATAVRRSRTAVERAPVGHVERVLAAGHGRRGAVEHEHLGGLVGEHVAEARAGT